jgi:hypothetical protein
MRRLILAVAFALPALAATLAGVTLEDHATVNNQHLVLNGMGLRKTFSVKVYVGGLYLPAKQSSAASVIATDGARRQVFHFLYSVSKSQMAEAWEEGLEDNTPNASPEVKTAFKTLQSWMEDIPKGNKLVVTYVPGIGTTVERDPQYLDRPEAGSGRGFQESRPRHQVGRQTKKSFTVSASRLPSS